MSHERWLTAADVADVLQLTVDEVYKAKALRGTARRIGDGVRPRLRWTHADLERAYPALDEARRDASNGAVPAIDSGGQPPIRRRRRQT